MLPYHPDVPPSLTIAPEVARRFLAIRHFLAPPRSLPAEPASVMTVVDRIGSLQFDPLEVAGRNHDLVLLARIAGYRRAWTDALLYEERQLFETYNKGLSLLPTKELPFYRWTWDRHRISTGAASSTRTGTLVDELLERIRTSGPMAAGDIEPREAIDWYWRPTNPVRAVLEALAEAGVLGLARRDGNRRVYDLAERLFPAELLARPHRTPREQLRHRLMSRYRAHGLLGRGGQAEIWMGLGRAAADENDPEWASRASPAHRARGGGLHRRRVGRGHPGRSLHRRRRAADAGRCPARGRGRRRAGRNVTGVAFLAPLDPLAWDREFLRTCFGFDYIWEVYVPAAKRRWGYYVLPILFGDRLVGRIEPRIDRKADTLRILGRLVGGRLRPARGRGVRRRVRRGDRGSSGVR